MGFSPNRTHNLNQNVFLNVTNNLKSQFKCSRVECLAMTFAYLQKFKIHLKQHLKKLEEISCPFDGCAQTFKIKSTFTSHLSRKHQHSIQLRTVGVDAEECRSSTSSENELSTSLSKNQSMTEDNIPVAGDLNEEISLNDFDFENDDETEAQYLKTLALFYLKLQGKYLLPASTIQVIVSEFTECQDINQNMLVKKVGDEMANFNISPEVIHAVKNEILRNDLFVKCNKGPLSSISKRTSFLKKNLLYVTLLSHYM